jgi:hypothetical protein
VLFRSFVADALNSANFYDALALGPAAFQTHMPILLTRGASVPSATRAAVETLETSAGLRFIGGPKSHVPDAVATALSIPGGNRLYNPSDSSRYATAIAIASTAGQRGWLSFQHLGVANRLPDALTGGVGMGRYDGPILYTPAKPLDPRTKAFMTAHKAEVLGVHVLGGPVSITDSTLAEIVAALQ